MCLPACNLLLSWTAVHNWLQTSSGRAASAPCPGVVVTHWGVLGEAGTWEKGGMEGMGRRNVPPEIEV